MREHLGLEPGDRIKFFVHPDGSVVLLPKLPVTTLRGIMKTRHATIEEMNRAIASQASESVVRRRRG